MADFVSSFATMAADAAESAGSWIASTASSAFGDGIAPVTVTAARTMSDLSSGASTLEDLRGGLTVFQGLSAIAGGLGKAAEMRTQAQAERANARGAVIAGKRARNDATDQLLDTIAGQRVALAASGVDAGAGTGQIFGTTIARGDFARGQSDLDAAIQARAHLLSGRGLMMGAGNAIAGGFVNAGIAGADYFQRRSARG